MQRKNEISEELRQLSMMVAGIDPRTPYEAPETYFLEFPGKMLALLTEGATEEAPAPDWGKSPSLSVPAGFFEGFASRMMDRIKAEEQGEFSPLLSRIGKNMPYQVPEGYFDTSLPSSVLMGLKDKTVYEVPEGYFETLPEIMTARVRTSEEKTSPAKVISISHSRKIWWKYSAAAVVAGFIFTIGWMRLHTSSIKEGSGNTNTDVAQGLAKVSDQDIQSFVEDPTAQLQQVQQEEDYANSTASLDIPDNDVKSLLGDVPDGELTQYMEDHGDLKDYPTN